MTASILGIASEVPQNILTQEQFVNTATRLLQLNDEQKIFLGKVVNASAIEKRHTVIADLLHGSYCGSEVGQPFPSTGRRNDIYKEEAPRLAESVCRKALNAWGGEAQEITHIVSVSCTGLMAPGVEFILLNRLGIPRSALRLGINFMGCFGAFKGLAVARALALENPKHRVLVVCTELCSLHFQSDTHRETLVANSIFADGAAAVVVGAVPRKNEKPLLELHRQQSMAFDNTLDLMTWDVGDQGYRMRLSHTIPAFLEGNLGGFTKELLGPNLTSKDCDWALHPGGKAILEGLSRAFALQNNELKHSWQVLKDYGNMSSSTFLFVLESFLKAPKSSDWVIGMAFGPGLSVEGALLKRVD